MKSESVSCNGVESDWNTSVNSLQGNTLFGWSTEMKKAIESLNLNRPQVRYETAGGVPLENTELLKEKLLEELVELDKQMQVLKSSGNKIDFSMMQTYKEMIHSRRTFFNELSR